jgi:tetratricopeptide (TPR) repeat protein
LSESLIQAGQYSEAIRAAQHALKVNQGKLDAKDQANLQYQLGVLMRQNGQLDQAIHHLDETIKNAPGFLNAYLEIAEAYRQRREHQKGLEYLKQAIALAPNDYRPYREAGIQFKEAKDYANAESMLRRAASLAPKDIDIQRKLGAVIALSLVHHPRDIEVD